MSQRAAVIMAAGKGTRMKDPAKAKVLYEINAKPMIHYVLDLAFDLNMDRIIVVVGHQREAVIEYLRKTHPSAEFAVQAEQRGTGHAVMQAEKVLVGFQGQVVVLSGDVPLLTRETMEELLTHHQDTKASATILTADFPDPTGYGRIVRNSEGSVEKIVEHRDASPDELRITEINSGIYVFEKRDLEEGLEHIKTDNVQHEYYLTDVFGYFWLHHRKVSALKARHKDEIQGINTIAQLDEARRLMEERLGAGTGRVPES